MSVCETCNDTHKVMSVELDREIMCTRCPTPCKECRAGGTGAFCESTPCPCPCHEKTLRQQLIDFTWKNCKHSKGRGHDYWLVCLECAVAFMREKGVKGR